MFSPSHSMLRLPAIGLLWLTATATCTASSLQVAPTSVTLAATDSAQGIWLSNSGDTPLHAQVRAFRWHQRNGEDLLDPSDKIAISPPMLELAPHSQQLVRIIRLDAAPNANEETYRILVDELPTKDADTSSNTGLQFVLRYSLPIFVKPVASVAPVLHAQLIHDGAAQTLEVANQGNEHAQVVDLNFVASDGRHIAITNGLAGYILPGQHKRWPLPATLAHAKGTFQAKINGASLAQPLPLDAAAP
ncbi:fimbrial biogenesis chaperone [Xanthomonas albilineans]|uniref:fimbrial biogenesis chaperone n=2 Tax=Xanthomonas albilineans TaxID=29447 RepID=UPI0005F3509B|nr:molecular chaperone [Xanthomonas albilineans]